ncbi:acyl-CoA dehydrogenase family protein [Bosea sp. (in: a-proteobacteria)]|uniref:acyl-CoA dehydrogenase family protein n=1 Tax=Bosea sp. (in: a-proteobacteria) TaxID=1871050 RepID=UPI002637A297|nr:acyl-CoA dehydrogenase family protein [Bosea sp. (in: a-proteobacteria)]MCO5089547.1 acyl-CoA dehydrogenase family protein [Bosea sp. (in: a-proteobacteria)]
MELGFTAEDIAFREEVRAFIAGNLPAQTRDHMKQGKHPTAQMIRDWQRRLNARGWAVPHWPREWGGQGWDAVRRNILREETEKAPAPSVLAFNTDMCGPILLAFGTEAQKKRFLPRMANLDDWWCQGFSEPGAGSDLASLRCAAAREQDHYVVNGQKVWTTKAQHADWMFMLVRTDPAAPKPQHGISFLLVDMRSAGITVRPTITIDGFHEVNEVFFDDVRVPVENRVGAENRGWDCAKLLLSNERTGHAKVGPSKERLRTLREYAATVEKNGGTLLDDPAFVTRLVDLEVQLKALEMTTMRVLAEDRVDIALRKPNPGSSVLKIRGSEIHQAISALFVEAAGLCGLAVPAGDGGDAGFPDWMEQAHPNYCNMRKLSIYGGSNEIQKTIMAKAFLGLSS